MQVEDNYKKILKIIHKINQQLYTCAKEKKKKIKNILPKIILEC